MKLTSRGLKLAAVPHRMNPIRFRYYTSLSFIVIGVALVLYVAQRHVDLTFWSSDPEPVQAIEPLPKGRAEECPTDWRFIDNTEQRFTICLPLNLVYFDGAGTQQLESASDADWARIFRDFVMVNDAGLALGPPGNEHAALAPISLRVDVVPPGTSSPGCDFSGFQAFPEDGIESVSCSDTFFLNGPQLVFAPDGPIHRFRALIPTQRGRSANEVFSLYLAITSLTADWPRQQPLFQELFDTLRPY